MKCVWPTIYNYNIEYIIYLCSYSFYEVEVIKIACAVSCNTWAANITIEWFPYSNVWGNKCCHNSETKVKLKILLDQISSFVQSACAYRNYYQTCFHGLRTLCHVYNVHIYAYCLFVCSLSNRYITYMPRWMGVQNLWVKLWFNLRGSSCSRACGLSSSLQQRLLLSAGTGDVQRQMCWSKGVLCPLKQ